MSHIYKAGLALALDQNLTPSATHRAAQQHRVYFDTQGNPTHRSDPLAATFEQGDGTVGERDPYGWIEPQHTTFPQHLKTLILDNIPNPLDTYREEYAGSNDKLITPEHCKLYLQGTSHNIPFMDSDILTFCRNRGINRKDKNRLIESYWDVLGNCLHKILKQEMNNDN